MCLQRICASITKKCASGKRGRVGASERVKRPHIRMYVRSNVCACACVHAACKCTYVCVHVGLLRHSEFSCIWSANWAIEHAYQQRVLFKHTNLWCAASTFSDGLHSMPDARSIKLKSSWGSIMRSLRGQGRQSGQPCATYPCCPEVWLLLTCWPAKGIWQMRMFNTNSAEVAVWRSRTKDSWHFCATTIWVTVNLGTNLNVLVNVQLVEHVLRTRESGSSMMRDWSSNSRKPEAKQAPYLQDLVVVNLQQVEGRALCQW